jgi:hypothetical protein
MRFTMSVTAPRGVDAGGLELYIDVVTSQTAAVANQRNDIDLMYVRVATMKILRHLYSKFGGHRTTSPSDPYNRRA